MTPHKVSRHLDPKGGPMRLVDYSTARPTPAQIRAAGYGGVMRYLSTYPPKNLDAAERDALLGAGLVIGLVWETTAARSAQGSAAGTADAQAAEAQADALGYPSSCPVFYAVDFAATPGQVLSYFAGVVGAARRPVGVYGSASIVEAVPVPWKWQTAAWSNGRISAQAHLYQVVGAAPIPSTDTNFLLRPVPLWGASTVAQVLVAPPGSSVTAPPAPAIAAPAPAQEDDMAYLVSSPSYGKALLSGSRLIGIHDQATVDAWAAKVGTPVPITDVDFLEHHDDTNLGVLLYNPPEAGGRGWAHLFGGRAVPLGDQATVDALKGKGVEVQTLSAADFARYVG